MLSAVWTRLSLREEFEGIDVAGTKSAGTGTSVPGTSVPGTSVPGESPVPDVTFTGGSGMMSVVAGGAVAEVEEMRTRNAKAKETRRRRTARDRSIDAARRRKRTPDRAREPPRAAGRVWSFVVGGTNACTM